MIKRAVEMEGQLGAEFEYLNKLKDEVIKENYDIDHDNLVAAAKDVKAEDRLIRRRIGRTMRAIFKLHKKIQEDEAELMKHMPASMKEELTEMLREYDPLFATLIKELPGIKGKLRQMVQEILGMVENAASLQKKGENVAGLEGQIKDKNGLLLKEIDLVVGRLQGLVVVEKKYEGLLERIEAI